MREYFPEPVDIQTTDLATANMLKIGTRERRSFFPSSSDADVLKTVGQFFQKRFLELGGRSHLQGFLTPSEDAQAAVLLLYLIDSGSNVAVGLNLSLNCLRPGEAPGFTKITGHKERAKGKPIYAELRTHSDTVQGLQWLVERLKPMRAIATGADRSRLLVRTYGDRVLPFNNDWFATWLRALVASIEGLQGCRIVPSMIRPSVLVKAVLERNGHAQVGQAIGQHGLNQSQTYQNKYPVIIQRTALIRKFQASAEAWVLRAVEEFQTVTWVVSDRHLPARRGSAYTGHLSQ
jgi:hypothetical protein